MTVYSLPYGHEKLAFELPDDDAAHFSVDWIEPKPVPGALDPIRVVREALRNPVDGKSLKEYASARSVAIAINDKTRPVPHEHLLPPLLEELQEAGIPKEAIQFFIATGTHTPMPRKEFNRVLPEWIIEQYPVVSHNCDDEANLTFLGTTTRETEVWANQAYLSADLRIVVGNIEPHHFAGFSGGYKTAAIGLTARKTITHNHTMLTDPNARIAEFDHNPLRQDIEEIGDKLGVQLALNAILNGKKKIVQAVCGHPRAVMQAGIPISREVCLVNVPGMRTDGKYDIVIASVGGAPKDINFYQSQKAITHASLFTRDNGVIILAAECPEGSGSRSYEEFMQGVESPQAVFDKFRQVGFKVGPHKAFQVARDASRVQIVLVSSIPNEVVSHLLLTPAASLSEAFELAMRHVSPTLTSQKARAGQEARIAILPRATNTIPLY